MLKGQYLCECLYLSLAKIHQGRAVFVFHAGVPWDWGKQGSPHPPLPPPGLEAAGSLTVHDEVDLSGVRLVAGLEGAGVEALVAQPHLGDEDGELLGRVNEQSHPWVTGPAVIARIQDVGAVQPGHTGHMLVYEAAAREDNGVESSSLSDPSLALQVLPPQGLGVGKGRPITSLGPTVAL